MGNPNIGKVGRHFGPGNPGRPKGARNKLGEAFLKALKEDFDAHGIATIQKARENDPVAYVKIIASLMPQQIDLNDVDKKNLSDAELISIIQENHSGKVLEGEAEPFEETSNVEIRLIENDK